MKYKEVLPDDIFTHHIECYWSMEALFVNAFSSIDLLLPTCTFNIMFVDEPCFIKLKTDSDWIYQSPGAVFLGQRNSCIHLRSNKPLNIYGIRFKPFAFANILGIPAYTLNDELVNLDSIFSIKSSDYLTIDEILKFDNFDDKTPLINELMFVLFKNSLSTDERLRAQLNYIMDRRGAIKINELFAEFNTNKVTLRKHFINKVGLAPKRVSQIWRMNHFLQMKLEQPNETLTSLCLSAGFYDQAHFIKEFKSIFVMTPKRFFSQSSHLISVAQLNISKRFTNQYDPKV